MQLLNKAAIGDMRALNTLVTWMRYFQEVVEVTEKPTQFSNENDKEVMENILKRMREIEPNTEGSEE